MLVALVVVVVARTAGVGGARELPLVSGFDPNDWIMYVASVFIWMLQK
jgi:hypothetical protein